MPQNTMWNHITTNCANKGLQTVVISKINEFINADVKAPELMVLTVQEGGFAEIRKQLDALCSKQSGFDYQCKTMRTMTKKIEMFHPSGLMNIVIAPNSMLKDNGLIELKEPDRQLYPQCTVNSTIPGEVRGSEFWSALRKNKSLTRWNKGGLVSVLKCGGRDILLKNVHLDSKGVDCRHQDFLAVSRYGPRLNAEIEKGELLNALVKRLDTLIVGDYNTRDVLDTDIGAREPTSSVSSTDGIAEKLDKAQRLHLVPALMGVSVGEQRDDAPSVSTLSDDSSSQSDDESDDDVFNSTQRGRPQSRSTYLPHGGRESPLRPDEKRPGYAIGGELDRFGSNGSIKLNNPVKELSRELEKGHDHVPLFTHYNVASLPNQEEKEIFVRDTLNRMLETFEFCTGKEIERLDPSCSIKDMADRFNHYFAEDGMCEKRMADRIANVKNPQEPGVVETTAEGKLVTITKEIIVGSPQEAPLLSGQTDDLKNDQTADKHSSPARFTAAWLCCCVSWFFKRLQCRSRSSPPATDKKDHSNSPRI
jgi:hypothetical protein